MPAALQITPANYTYLLEQIHRDSGISLDDTKMYLIEARLGPIVQKERLATLDDLCALLKQTDRVALRRQVVEAMTTNETLFFRDAPLFEALQQTVLPELVQKRGGVRRLSIWSAAASTGQEAYSIAMLLAEMGLSGWDIRIVGTDLNHQVLERARAGRYAQMEVNRGLPAKFMVKYFYRVGVHWHVADAVRTMVSFAPFDLRENMSGLGPFDLILCRNVLIYFDPGTKASILAGLHQRIGPGGFLSLGSAESALSSPREFVRRIVGSATLYQTC